MSISARPGSSTADTHARISAPSRHALITLPLFLFTPFALTPFLYTDIGPALNLTPETISTAGIAVMGVSIASLYYRSFIPNLDRPVFMIALIALANVAGLSLLYAGVVFGASGLAAVAVAAGYMALTRLSMINLSEVNRLTHLNTNDTTRMVRAMAFANAISGTSSTLLPLLAAAVLRAFDVSTLVLLGVSAATLYATIIGGCIHSELSAYSGRTFSRSEGINGFLRGTRSHSALYLLVFILTVIQYAAISFVPLSLKDLTPDYPLFIGVFFVLSAVTNIVGSLWLSHFRSRRASHDTFTLSVSGLAGVAGLLVNSLVANPAAVTAASGVCLGVLEALFLPTLFAWMRSNLPAAHLDGATRDITALTASVGYAAAGVAGVWLYALHEPFRIGVIGFIGTLLLLSAARMHFLQPFYNFIPDHSQPSGSSQLETRT